MTPVEALREIGFLLERSRADTYRVRAYRGAADAVAAMMKYNEALKNAGVLITLDGLHPPSMGARVSFAGDKPLVTDGPFAEAKEVLGGYWMIDVASRDEAIAWACKCPAGPNEVIEIRQVQEMADFPEDVQQAAAGFQELQRKSRA